MPYEVGRLRDGLGRGPERLLELGAADALARHGGRVRTELVELPEEQRNEVDAGFELIRLVAERVSAARSEGAFPVVLSGSCFAAVGVIAGLQERAPGVVWFDAHGDFNAPETSISGYFDGMALAVLTGSAWQGLLATVPGARPLPETSVILAGARDLEEPEEERLVASSVRHLRPEELEAPDALASAVEALSPPASGLYVHVDLDVLDSDEAPVNTYSAPGGPSRERLERLVAGLLRSFPVRALSLTAYDPGCDTDDRVPPVALRILECVGAEHERSLDDER
jgi:arginase